MAARHRSRELLLQAIEQDLAQITSEASPVALALWPEADSMAGYLVHRDGRMVPVGDYQHGFSSLREMAGEGLDEEAARASRHELGTIAGSLEALEAGTPEAMEAAEQLSYAFGVDAPRVEQAFDEGRLTLAQAFELLAQEGVAMVQEGRSYGGHEVTLSQDLVVSRLTTAQDGGLAWEARVVARAGETLRGQPHGGGARVDVEGGVAVVPQGACTLKPGARAHSGLRCG